MQLSRKQALLLTGAVVLAVGASVLLQRIVAIYFEFDEQDLRDWIEGFGAIGPLVYIGFLAMSIVVGPVPTAAPAIAAGLAFGIVLGSIYTLAGGLLGGVTCFLLARRFGRPWLSRRVNPATLEYVDRLALSLGPRVILITRLIPVFGFEWVSYAAGLTKMHLGTFTIWTAIGATPTIVAASVIGEEMQDNPLVALAILAVLVAAALGTVAYYTFKRHTVGTLVQAGRSTGVTPSHFDTAGTPPGVAPASGEGNALPAPGGVADSQR